MKHVKIILYSITNGKFCGLIPWIINNSWIIGGQSVQKWLMAPFGVYPEP